MLLIMILLTEIDFCLMDRSIVGSQSVARLVYKFLFICMGTESSLLNALFDTVVNLNPD